MLLEATSVCFARVGARAVRLNSGQYYLDLGEYLSGVGWLCSARYREVRDDAVGPAEPTLFETGMDLLDTTLSSGGGDQVLARGGDCVSCWGRTFIQDDCTLAPVVCKRTLSSCGKYVPDRNWLSGA